MAYRVLGANVSPFVRKVRAFFAEKGVEYELEQVNPFSPPDGWTEISPLGRIPALDHQVRVVGRQVGRAAFRVRSVNRRVLHLDSRRQS